MAGQVDGTVLGCIGLCRECGKAIQLRRFKVSVSAHIAHLVKGFWTDRWEHFGLADHPATPKPGVLERTR